jgi:hypothetical protein
VKILALRFILDHVLARLREREKCRGMKRPEEEEHAAPLVKLAT